MSSKPFSSSGIVLSCRDFGEADRIVTVFSKNIGKLSLMAKGVRRLKSKKRGHIEVFNNIKFQAISGRGMPLLTEVELVDNFASIKTSLKKISLGYYVSEVVLKITHDEEPNLMLFDLLNSTYKSIAITKKLRDLRLKFILNLLVILGYWDESTPLDNPDQKLEEIIERQIVSARIGKKISI